MCISVCASVFITSGSFWGGGSGRGGGGGGGGGTAFKRRNK
jgi:hypothetical protein